VRRGLILLGGGEHARSVGWAAQSAHGDWLRGLVDPQPVERTCSLLSVTRLGGDERVAELAVDHDFVLGIGAIGISPLRRTVCETAAAVGARFTAVLHATAMVAPSATIAPGAVVLAGAIVGPGAKIGAHAVVNTGAIVEHDCEIGELAQIAPGVVLGGGVRVGADAFVGLGARIRDHVVIGRGALVGMGAVVVQDVDAEAIVTGVPARAKGARHA
jgi:acetyltransferase EpsM